MPIQPQLLPTYQNPVQTQLAMPQVQPLDFGAALKGYAGVTDLRQKQEEHQMNMKKAESSMEAEKFMNRLREEQAKAIQPNLEFERDQLKVRKAELENDISKSAAKELDDLRKHQGVVIEWAKSIKDPEIRKKIADIYNNDVTAKKYGSTISYDSVGNISYEPPKLAESSISKEASQIVGKNVVETRDTQKALQNIDQSLFALENMPAGTEPGYFAGYKQVVGNMLQGLGMKNALVEQANDYTQLSKSLNATSLSLMRPLLGAQFTAKEGEMVRETFGKITDPKESLMNSLKAIKASHLGDIQEKTIMNLIAENNPKDLTVANTISQQIMSFPKVVFTIDNQGKKTLDDYYKFAEWYKQYKNPNADYVELREAWNDAWREATGSNKYIGVKNLPQNTQELLKKLP